MYKTLLGTLGAAAVFSCPSDVAAQEGAAVSGSVFGILQAEDAGYAGSDGETRLLPYAKITWGRWAFDLEGEVSFGVAKTETFEMRLLAAYRAVPDFPDAALFEGLNRADGLDLGISAAWQMGAVSLTAEVVADPEAEAGIEAVFEAKQVLPVGRVIVAPYAGVTWRDADRGGYLFGVTPSEATVVRGVYDTGATLSPHLGVDVVVPLSERLNLLGGVEHEFLADGLRDSPLADGHGRTTAILGVQYQF